MAQPLYVGTAVINLVFLSLVAGERDNRGKEFILGFMQNLHSDGRGQLKLFVTTSINETVHVKITSPNWNKSYLNENFTVTAGQIKELKFGNDLCMEETKLSTKGILVNASHEVTVYGMNMEEGSTDAFLALPTDVLGTNYYAVTYYLPNGMTNNSQFLIIGTEDNTTINIVLSKNKHAKDVHYNGKSYKPGEVINLVMDRYDTLQVQSEGDLTGSHITTNRPISFFSGNRFASVGTNDLLERASHLVEQLIPVETWGNRFATCSYPEDSSASRPHPVVTMLGDYIKVVASSKETNVSITCGMHGINGTMVFRLLDAGDFLDQYLGSDLWCFIESNKPILYILYSLCTFVVRGKPLTGGPTMIMIPPIEQYSAEYTVTTTKSIDNEKFSEYFIFIVKHQDAQGIRSDFTVGRFGISPGVHTVGHSSNTDIFYGYLIGHKDLEAYGFPIGFRVPDVSAESTSEQMKVDAIDNNLSWNGNFKLAKKTVDIRSGTIWQKAKILTDLHCAETCFRDTQCIAFSYHKGKQLCQGHGRRTSTSQEHEDL